LLESICIDFEIVLPEYEEEDLGSELPAELVERHSRGKAWSALPWLKPLDPGNPVLGVDTMVVIDGRAVGKPAGEEEARAILRRLSGRTHLVYTGITLVWTGTGEEAGQMLELTENSVTEVRFEQIPEPEMELFLAGGEWRERAGGYAIQGRASAFVAEIRGDYTNVVGLPVPLLVRMMRQQGFWPPVGWSAG
jgi:septum formation protein